MSSDIEFSLFCINLKNEDGLTSASYLLILHLYQYLLNQTKWCGAFWLTNRNQEEDKLCSRNKMPFVCLLCNETRSLLPLVLHRACCCTIPVAWQILLQVFSILFFSEFPSTLKVVGVLLTLSAVVVVGGKRMVEERRSRRDPLAALKWLECMEHNKWVELCMELCVTRR